MLLLPELRLIVDISDESGMLNIYSRCIWVDPDRRRINEVLVMEYWLYYGWMGGCVRLQMCMCTCISIHTCLQFDLAIGPSRVRSVFYFQDCVGSTFWFEVTQEIWVPPGRGGRSLKSWGWSGGCIMDGWWLCEMVNVYVYIYIYTYMSII